MKGKYMGCDPVKETALVLMECHVEFNDSLAVLAEGMSQYIMTLNSVIQTEINVVTNYIDSAYTDLGKIKKIDESIQALDLDRLKEDMNYFYNNYAIMVKKTLSIGASMLVNVDKFLANLKKSSLYKGSGDHFKANDLPELPTDIVENYMIEFVSISSFFHGQLRRFGEYVRN